MGIVENWEKLHERLDDIDEKVDPIVKYVTMSQYTILCLGAAGVFFFIFGWWLRGIL